MQSLVYFNLSALIQKKKTRSYCSSSKRTLNLARDCFAESSSVSRANSWTYRMYIYIKVIVIIKTKKKLFELRRTMME